MEGGSAEKKDREGDGAYSPQLSVQNFGYVCSQYTPFSIIEMLPYLFIIKSIIYDIYAG